ncbi:MAG: molybdate ABC transporter substrate-binding protein [Syntrophomonadaceae bacterium]|nr:molybdate ABC transporter substrate-binding protein [Syntrophomonadaceae bacterium]MDD3023121.1 molybdate ABC transporter substrate-binding protein [Syntrophomonadaceae bacterium]
MKKFCSILLTIILVMGLALVAGCSKEEPAPQPAEQEKTSFEGKTLNLYVAAGMKKPMDQVIKSFEEESKAKVAVNYGPSGGLYAQIEQGQPCDLYYSADWIYIDKTEQAGKLEEGKKFLKDNMVVVVSKTGKSKVAKIEDLGNANVTIVIADPQAPAGAYAKKGIETLGLWEKVSPNVKAMPTTVNQVAIMVKEDQVDAGLVYSSVANGNEMEIVEVLDEKYTGDIVFGSAVIKGGDTELARAFAQCALDNITVFEQYGWKAYE